MIDKYFLSITIVLILIGCVLLGTILINIGDNIDNINLKLQESGRMLDAMSNKLEDMPDG